MKPVNETPPSRRQRWKPENRGESPDSFQLVSADAPSIWKESPRGSGLERVPQKNLPRLWWRKGLRWKVCGAGRWCWHCCQQAKRWRESRWSKVATQRWRTSCVLQQPGCCTWNRWWKVWPMGGALTGAATADWRWTLGGRSPGWCVPCCCWCSSWRAVCSAGSSPRRKREARRRRRRLSGPEPAW